MKQGACSLSLLSFQAQLAPGGLGGTGAEDTQGAAGFRRKRARGRDSLRVQPAPEDLGAVPSALPFPSCHDPCKSCFPTRNLNMSMHLTLMPFSSGSLECDARLARHFYHHYGRPIPRL
eukprot:1161518-Pelagomonas_calceolata.AAC.10